MAGEEGPLSLLFSGSIAPVPSGNPYKTCALDLAQLITVLS